MEISTLQAKILMAQYNVRILHAELSYRCIICGAFIKYGLGCCDHGKIILENWPLTLYDSYCKYLKKKKLKPTMENTLDFLMLCVLK